MEPQDAARARGIALSIFTVSKPDEIGSAMRMATRSASFGFPNVQGTGGVYRKWSISDMSGRSD